MSMTTKGNLVLGRKAQQSVFIGKVQVVKVTVVDSHKMSLSFQTSDDININHTDERTCSMIVDNSEVTITTVSTNGKTVKLAIRAERHIPVDREEVRIKNQLNQ